MMAAQIKNTPTQLFVYDLSVKYMNVAMPKWLVAWEDTKLELIGQ